MGRGKKDGQKYAILKRRMEVAELLVMGLMEWQVAEKLGVPKGTITSDAKIIRDEWRYRQQYAADINRGEHVAKLDTIMQTLWPRIFKGDDHAVNTALRTLDQRARIMGYATREYVGLSWDQAQQIAAEFGVPITDVVAEMERVQADPVAQALLPPGTAFGPISGHPRTQAQIVEEARGAGAGEDAQEEAIDAEWSDQG